MQGAVPLYHPHQATSHTHIHASKQKKKEARAGADSKRDYKKRGATMPRQRLRRVARQAGRATAAVVAPTAAAAIAG